MLNAEEVSGGKAKFVSSCRPSLKWAVLRASPLDARDDLVFLGCDLLNFAMVVTEPCQPCCNELFSSGDAWRQVCVVLDKIRR
jgi:hypothetical protein